MTSHNHSKLTHSARVRERRLLLAVAWLAFVIVAGEAIATSGPINYREVIMFGDRIVIDLAEDADFHFDGVVDDSGRVELPYLGEFKVVGMEPDACEKKLSDVLLQRLYHKATVTVKKLNQTEGKVHVFGAVKRPGTVHLPLTGDVSILYALSMAGELHDNADLERCRIQRDNPGSGHRKSIDVNLAALEDRPGQSKDFVLVPNDIIYVPYRDGRGEDTVAVTEPSVVAPEVSASNAPTARGPVTITPERGVVVDGEVVFEVYVFGAVARPGVVRFSTAEQARAIRAIFRAGGFTPFARRKNVRLVRHGADGQRTEQQLNLKRLMEEGYLEEDVPLVHGDVLVVPEKKIRF